MTTFAVGFRAWVALVALGIWSTANRVEATEKITTNLLRGSGEPSVDLPQKSTRIINGDVVKEDRYPYFSLMFGRGMCGGVLIHPRLVLTAAHCEGASEFFRIGAYESTTNAEFISIRSAVLHPQYDRSRFDMDVMIYELKQPSKHPYIRLDPNYVKNGDYTVIGFGDMDKGAGMTLSKTLQEVELFYVDNDTCDKGHGGNNEVTRDMMCVEGKDKDSCIGDSGGPLIRKGDGPEFDTLVGVVSWGRECAMKGVPGVYARVSYFYDWIIDTVCKISPEDAPEYMGCEVTPPPTNKPTNNPTNYPTAKPVYTVPEIVVVNCTWVDIKPFNAQATGVTFVCANNTEVDLTEGNVTEGNVTEVNVTEVNATEVNATEINATEVNATEGNVTDMNATEVDFTEGDISEVNVIEGKIIEERPRDRIPIGMPTMMVPTRAPIPRFPSNLAEATFVSWQFVMMQECQGHCTSDIQCAGDLVCFKRNMSADIPGCSPGPIGLNVDVCIDPSFLP